MTTIWGLVDDRTGHTGQVLGVIHRLGVPYTLKRLEYNLLANLPTAMLGASTCHLNPRSAPLTSPFPPLVIAAGRRTLPVLRHIKHHSPSTGTVYLMKPEIDRDIDLIAMPQHDHPPSAPHIVSTVAPLHAVTPEALAGARQAWEAKLAHLPRPYIGLCLGGATKHGNFSAAEWREVIMRAQAFAGEGSLLITTSRRTPKEALDLCNIMVQKPHLFYAWDRGTDNPYLGILALADGIIVTGDSLSMCAEAATSGAPLFIFAPEKTIPPKHRALHAALYQRGLAKPLSGMVRMDWRPTAPLDDTGMVAAEIRARFPEVFAASHPHG